MKLEWTAAALVLAMLSAGIAAAQQTSTANDIEGLSEFVGQLMEQWYVPGLAIGVVKDGQVFYARGFGCKSIQTREPVTTGTLFGIASCTKAFTAMAVCLLADEGKLDLDAPVIEYMGDFRLADEYATMHATPRDLLCHRTGLARHDGSWIQRPISRLEMYRSMRHLQFRNELRETFEYNNLMYMTLGILVERVSGMSYEEFVRERIFAPLGMKSSLYITDNPRQAEDLASSYRSSGSEDGAGEPLDFDQMSKDGDIIAPMGGAYSNIEDMTKWLALLLNEGKLREEQFVSRRAFAQMLSPHSVLRRRARYPEFPVRTYGLGWHVDPYRGHEFLCHTGGGDGWCAYVSFMPADGIGIVVLTNKYFSPIGNTISYYIYDRLLGLEPVDWNGRYAAIFLSDDGEDGEEEPYDPAADPDRVQGAEPTHAPEAFAGTYDHPGYGRVLIRCEEGSLRAVFDDGTVDLVHYHFNVFADKEYPGEGFIRFHIDDDGQVKSLSMALERGMDDIVFERKASDE